MGSKTEEEIFSFLNRYSGNKSDQLKTLYTMLKEAGEEQTNQLLREFSALSRDLPLIIDDDPALLLLEKLCDEENDKDKKKLFVKALLKRAVFFASCAGSASEGISRMEIKKGLAEKYRAYLD